MYNRHLGGYGDNDIFYGKSIRLFIDKPESLYDVKSEDTYLNKTVSHKMDRIFIAVATASQSPDEHRIINLLGPLEEDMKTELQELFRPQDRGEVTYTEFYRGLNGMCSAYAARDREIQKRANMAVRNLLYTASRRAKVPLDNVQPKTSTESTDSESKDAIRDSTSAVGEKGVRDDNPHNLFRSSSVTSESVSNKDYFLPDGGTQELIQICFPDLFTEDNSSQSKPFQDADGDVQFRYGQLWEFFGSGGASKATQVVKR